MLIEFSVGNYKSFREKVTLSMVAAAIRSKDKVVDENNVVETDQKFKLLTSAAIYGANASGKTNLLSAVRFMTNFIADSAKDTQTSEKIPTDRFRLSKEFDDKPSHFEMVFLMEGKRYRYGFEVSSDKVVSEWLYCASKSKEAKLFERSLQDISIGTHFKEGKEFIPRTRNNALFLSVVAQWNGQLATQIVSWFQMIGVPYDIGSGAVPYFSYDSPEDLKVETLKFIKALDVSIKDFSLEPFQVPKSLPAQMKEDFEKLGLAQIKTVHNRYDAAGKVIGSVEFSLEKNESAGTRKLFSLHPLIFLALELGVVIFVDELEVKLHPILTFHIIQLFNNRHTNPKHAQLIFTSHDRNLLDHRYFRRDQIWFTEKDNCEASHLHSLAEFKVRNDASFGLDYIRGKYGGIPFIGNLDYLFEQESKSE